MRKGMVALVAMLAVCVPAASAAKPRSAIVSPTNGKVVRTHTVKIVVRAPDESHALRARLNGKPVERDFGPAKKGRRSFTASLNHGLRKGRNVLRVRVRVPGQRARTATARFVVEPKADLLVGAGRDRRIPLGATVRLHGRVAGGDKGQAVRWRRVTASGEDTSKPLALLSRPNSLDATFDANTLGRYRVRLTAGNGDGAVSDSAEFTVVPASPLVEVDTMAKRDGLAAVRVGTQLYQAPEPVFNEPPRAFVHVLVLDRATLKLVSQTGYLDTDKLAADLRRLDDDRLVIVGLRRRPFLGSAPLTGSISLTTALQSIGFPKESEVGPLSTRAGETVSAIGVPGTEPGDAEVNINPDGAGMTGYLTPDQYYDYRYLSPEMHSFEQKPLAPTCSTDCRVGYVVSDIDPYRYTELRSAMFETNPQGGDGPARFDKAQKALGDMADFVSKIPDGHLIRIAVQSHWIDNTPNNFIPPIPTPFGSTTAGFSATYSAMSRLADAIANAGGTRNGFNRTALNYGPGGGQPVYTLLGWQGAGEGEGAEAAMDVDGANIYSLLSATVRRNRLHVFRPVRPSFAPVSDAIDRLVVQAPQPDQWWPAGQADAESLKRAVTWIGGQVGRLGCDPRAAYWTEVVTEANALSIKDDVDLVTMPTTADSDVCSGRPYQASDFTEAQFTAAKTQLKKELGWAGKVRDFLEKRSSPFADGGLESWADAQTIADKIYESAKPPEGSEAIFEWLEFTEIILKLLGPETGGVSSEISELIQLGVWIAGAETDGRPSGDEVRFKADELGTELVRQAEATKATFRQLGDIIISDPVKLREAGSNANCVPGPNCPSAYEVARPQAQAAAAAVFYRGIERTAFEKLLPLGYRVTWLDSYSWYRDKVAKPSKYDCPYSYPFSETWPDAAGYTLIQVLSPDDLDNNLFQPVVLTAIPGSDDRYAAPPPNKLLERMFDPVSRSNDPEKGGLGMTLSGLSLTSRHWGWRYDDPGRDGCTWDLV